MRRKVVETRTYRPERTIPSAFKIVDTLECGHEVMTKGSAGYAKYRDCSECQGWVEGHTTYKAIGDKEEKWNSETQMPYWEDIKHSQDKELK